jgi:hypothetical protein
MGARCAVEIDTNGIIANQHRVHGLEAQRVNHRGAFLVEPAHDQRTSPIRQHGTGGWRKDAVR